MIWNLRGWMGWLSLYADDDCMSIRFRMINAITSFVAYEYAIPDLNDHDQQSMHPIPCPSRTTIMPLVLPYAITYNQTLKTRQNKESEPGVSYDCERAQRMLCRACCRAELGLKAPKIYGNNVPEKATLHANKIPYL